MKIRKRKIVVISFYEILFVNLYFMFTFTFGDIFYFFFTFSILRFFYEKNILWNKNVNRQSWKYPKSKNNPKMLLGAFNQEL